MYKFITLCAALAAANAGLISGPAPISYTGLNYPAPSIYASPGITYSSPIHGIAAAPSLAYSHAPALPVAKSYSYFNQASYRAPAPSVAYTAAHATPLTYAPTAPAIPYGAGPAISYASPYLAHSFTPYPGGYAGAGW